MLRAVSGLERGDVVIISPSLKVGWPLTLPTILPLSRSCHSSRVVAASKEVEDEVEVANAVRVVVGSGLVKASTLVTPKSTMMTALTNDFIVAIAYCNIQIFSSQLYFSHNRMKKIVGNIEWEARLRLSRRVYDTDTCFLIATVEWNNTTVNILQY